MDHLAQNGVDRPHRKVQVISMDGFYRELNKDEMLKATKGQFNLDHPSRSKICQNPYM